MRGNYVTYTIGCCVVWAGIWLGVGLGTDNHTKHVILLVFGGWVIGWVSASIARTVYPPPRER